MIKLITGVPGTGKTKMLIGMVNEAVKATNGNVVCIEKGIKLRFDINYNVRLINTDEYLIDDAQSLFGFLSGIIASNHDVTEIFIDSALKICQNDMPAFETAVNEMEQLANKTNVNIIITSSIPKGQEPESLKKYIQ
ncbi:MAG: hypothetical protein SO125_07550 [Eubacteriales bacterium]|nr:hypothetical protein [Eubacteriales bacterium]MDY4898788.1 hypothetical protein [Eubacteriales bacterium]